MGFPFSLNYIIQAYYRLKGRKGHHTLEYEKLGKQKILQVFFSFLSIFHSEIFKKPDLNKIYLYGLVNSDEKIREGKNMLEFIISFKKLIDNITPNKFSFEKLKNFNDEIENFVNSIESLFPEDAFEPTAELLREQIICCNIYFLIFSH